MNKRSVYLLCVLCSSLLAALMLSVPANAQATVIFTNPSITIDQGTSVVDFFGQIDNSAGTSAYAPGSITISGSAEISPLVTTYDSLGNPNNFAPYDPPNNPIAIGAVSSQIDFFSVDTSNLANGTYTGSMTVSDTANSNFTAPANFSITVTAAPEPSACAALAVGAIGLGVLVLRARRKPTA